MQLTQTPIRQTPTRPITTVLTPDAVDRHPELPSQMGADHPIPLHLAQRDHVDTMRIREHPGGGVLILGLDEVRGFAATGCEYAGKLAADIAGLCRDGLVPPLMPLISQPEFEDRTLVVAEVPELDPADKPCYGRPPGAGRLAAIIFFQDRAGHPALLALQCLVAGQAVGSPGRGRGAPRRPRRPPAPDREHHRRRPPGDRGMARPGRRRLAEGPPAADPGRAPTWSSTPCAPTNAPPASRQQAVLTRELSARAHPVSRPPDRARRKAGTPRQSAGPAAAYPAGLARQVSPAPATPSPFRPTPGAGDHKPRPGGRSPRAASPRQTASAPEPRSSASLGPAGTRGSRTTPGSDPCRETR